MIAITIQILIVTCIITRQSTKISNYTLDVAQSTFISKTGILFRYVKCSTQFHDLYHD